MKLNVIIQILILAILGWLYYTVVRDEPHDTILGLICGTVFGINLTCMAFLNFGRKIFNQWSTAYKKKMLDDDARAAAYFEMLDDIVPSEVIQIMKEKWEKRYGPIETSTSKS